MVTVSLFDVQNKFLLFFSRHRHPFNFKMVRLSSSIIMSKCDVTNICNVAFGTYDITQFGNIIALEFINSLCVVKIFQIKCTCIYIFCIGPTVCLLSSSLCNCLLNFTLYVKMHSPVVMHALF